MPFFSIVIPVYNRPVLIARTINSILEQTFNDYELIIVDDGSTDNTGEIVKKIAIENTKIKYLWQQNKERGAARNYGFKNASGVYVVFLDSDDIMHPDHLAILYNKIKEQNSPNLIATKYLLARGNKNTVNPVIKQLKECYYDINLLLSGSHFGCNYTIKRNNPGLHLFIEDRHYHVFEDWMFITQNLNHDKIYVIDAFTITMNDHDDRSMRRNYKEITRKRILAALWMEKNINLTLNQRKMLWGFSYEFCAVYSYIDGKRGDTFQYLFKSISLLGIDKMKAALLLKNIIGYKLIHKFRR